MITLDFRLIPFLVILLCDVFLSFFHAIAMVLRNLKLTYSYETLSTLKWGCNEMHL